jgi:hypothetical protein
MSYSQARGEMRARALLLLLAATMALVLALLVGCGGGGGQQEQEVAAEPVVGSFVGQAREADAFVAIVAEKPQQGGAAREGRAWVCDGQRISW